MQIEWPKSARSTKHNDNKQWGHDSSLQGGTRLQQQQHCTAARMVHVRHVIVRYRTSRRTSPYEPLYGTSSYGTVRVAAPEPTRRRTAPYESPYDDVRAAVWHRTRHRMIPYEPPYVSVRCVVRCRTAARTVPYVGSYGHIATTWTCIANVHTFCFICDQ